MYRFFVLVFVVLSLSITSCKKKKVANLEWEFKKAFAEEAFSSYYSVAYHSHSLVSNIHGMEDGNFSETNWNDLKSAYLQFREAYCASRVYEIEGGPIFNLEIDDKTNGWPIEPGYIDYIESDSGSGIINDTTIEITLNMLESLHLSGGNNRHTLGIHVIEFLIFGEDLTVPEDELPGQRPMSDYEFSGIGSIEERRLKYLTICIEKISEDMDELRDQWAEGGSFRSSFLNEDDHVTVTKIFDHWISLIKYDLLENQISKLIDTGDDIYEESRFSDYTFKDIHYTVDGLMKANNSDLMKKLDKKSSEDFSGNLSFLYELTFKNNRHLDFEVTNDPQLLADISGYLSNALVSLETIMEKLKKF